MPLASTATTAATSSAMSPLHACRQHTHVAQFEGPAEAQLLASASHALLHAIEPTLHRLLELTPDTISSSPSLLDAVPKLKLQFNSLARYDSYLTDVDRPGILSAFASLARHAQRLNAFPEFKTAFWTDVLLSSLIGIELRSTPKSLFQNPEFPLFVIDFSPCDYARWCTVNESLEDELFAFMTIPPAVQRTQVAFGLSFANCELTVASLEIIEHFLDRTFAHPTRQYTIKLLDLSDSSMDPSALAIVARIVDKCKCVYQIEELKLDNILPIVRLSGYRPQEETSKEFLDIVRAACDVDRLPRLASRALSGITFRDSPSCLHKISLSNSVRPALSAVMFSSLRYRCPLEEDISSYIVSQYKNEQTNVEAWRWLAFGLFYPRFKRFASSFKLRTTGNMQLSPAAIRIIMNTVRNPARELVYDGKDVQSSSVMTDTLLVCTVKKGASIEIFEFGQTSEATLNGEKVTWTDTLAEQSELEALCERQNGSLCVVIPGVGLGWVQSEAVERIEREPLTSDRSEQDGWFDATFGVSESETHVEDLKPLMTTVGRQFRSLTFDFIDSVRSMFGLSRLTYPAPAPQTLSQIIGDHCVNLTRLNLNSASAVEISGLLDALDGELGRRLLVLNLNGNQDCFNDESAVRLATLLMKMENPLTLQEVRLYDCWFGVKGLRSLSRALQVNRTLALIELTGARMVFSSDNANLIQERETLDAANQGQLLQITVPMETKLAFLSVVAGDKQPGEKNMPSLALNSLDPSVLSLVFQFAASHEVRRTIVWNSDLTHQQ